MPLPTTKKTFFKAVNELFITVYGPPKIGKTDFAHYFGNGEVLYLASEAGQDFIPSYSVTLTNWQDFLNTVSELERLGPKAKSTYSAIAVDTIDNLFRWCSDFTIDRINSNSAKQIEHESELAMGRGYALVNRAWFDGINSLINVCRKAGLGLCFISHARVSIDPNTQTERVRPGIPDAPFLSVSGACDMILYMSASVNEAKEPIRIFNTKSTPKVEAGDRTGSLPAVLKLGKSGKEAIEAFSAAYLAGIEQKKKSLGLA
jgi:hypothetical protein